MTGSLLTFPIVSEKLIFQIKGTSLVVSHKDLFLFHPFIYISDIHKCSDIFDFQLFPHGSNTYVQKYTQ